MLMPKHPLSNLSIVAAIRIKVPDEKSPSTSNGVGTPNSELEAYPLAKVLKISNLTKEMM